jgi:hypothetical protein
MTDTAVEDRHCLNCSARLTGQYCGECGQRATSRLISIWELVRDAFGDMFELDSRLWRTIRPLLFRPGLLTKDYLEGRRARYMPPFRMYLVLSLIFFVVAFFDPRNDFAFFYEPETLATLEAEEAQEATAEAEEQRDEARKVLQELADEGVIDPDILDPESPTGIAVDEIDAAIEDDGVNVSIDGNAMSSDCEVDDWNLEGPEWLNRRFTPERVRQICERVVAVGWQGVGEAVLDRVPAGLLVLLPAMAFVLMVLYPLSRRYYVEHLLFVVHFHAFFFLILTLQVLWGRLVATANMPEALGVLPIVATAFYIPVYLHKSMRRVYGQGGFVTFLKFMLLTWIYVFGFALVLFASILLAVSSV